MSNTSNTRTSKSYRIIIMPDFEPYQHGDYENDEDRAETNALIEREGLWGYAVERLKGSEWQTIDSCFGFIGSDIEQSGMADYLNSYIPAGYDIPVYHTGEFGKISEYDYASDSHRKPAKRKRAA